MQVFLALGLFVSANDNDYVKLSYRNNQTLYSPISFTSLRKTGKSIQQFLDIKNILRKFQFFACNYDFYLTCINFDDDNVPMI